MEKLITETDKNQNNIIKNLKYEVTIKGNNKYTITAKTGYILFEDSVEVVFMENVEAIFTDEDNKKLYVSSKKAKFNSNNYNTFFDGKVEIKYDENIITSKKLDFNFMDNNILIYDNVRFSNFDKKLETDNIRIDIITRNIEIFMNELNNNVKIRSF